MVSIGSPALALRTRVAIRRVHWSLKAPFRGDGAGIDRMLHKADAIGPAGEVEPQSRPSRGRVAPSAAGTSVCVASASRRVFVVGIRVRSTRNHLTVLREQTMPPYSIASSKPRL